MMVVSRKQPYQNLSETRTAPSSAVELLLLQVYAAFQVPLLLVRQGGQFQH